MIGRGSLPWRALALFAALPVTSCPLVHAATSDQAAPVIEEVIVTASRRAESLQDTALSVSAIQPDDLAISGLVKMREVVEYAPGVHYSGGQYPTANTVTMRGVSQVGRASTVGIYWDDVPLGSSTSFAAGPTLHFDGVQGDVERIELIRGPQGTLYGSSAMGGVMRYITRDPTNDGIQASADVDVSDTAEGSSNHSVRGRISVPLIDDRLGLSVAAYREDFGGFIDRIEDSPTGAANNVDAFERTGVYTKLKANPTERLDATLLYAFTETTSRGGNLVALQGPPFALADGKFDTDEGKVDLEDEFDIGALTLRYDFDSVTLISSTSYQERSSSNAADLVATFGGLVDLLEGNAPGTTTSAPFTGLITTDRFVQELRLESAMGGRLEWTVGAIYSTEDSSNIQTLQGQPTGFLALDVDLASELDELAGFGNVRYFFTEDFDIGIGVRLASIESSVALTDGPGLIVANLPEVESDDTVDTYNLTARYRPSDDLSLYARIASGYRPENANLPLLDSSGQNAAPPIIETDTLWSYEVGAKGLLADGRFSYDAAVYYLNWKDPQVVTFVNGASTGGNANSDVTAYGFEATGSVQFFEQLVLTATASYVDSTLDDDETAAFGALEGESMPLIPEWTASLRANYDFAITDGLDGFISGGVRYVDSRNTGFEGGIGEDGSTISPLIRNFTLDSYAVADLGIGVRARHFSATLYGNNLFNEYAFTGGSARPVVGFTRATASVLQPRTVGLKLSVNY